MSKRYVPLATTIPPAPVMVSSGRYWRIKGEQDILSMNKYNPRHWVPFYSSIDQFKNGDISAAELAVAMILSGSLFLGFLWNIDQRYAAEVVFLCVMMSLSGNFMNEISNNVSRKRIFFSVLGLLFSTLLLRRWLNGGEVVHLVSFVSGVVYFTARIFMESLGKLFFEKIRLKVEMGLSRVVD